MTRTCRLCGKPLSRIRVGSGDFCSREHHNQYRLRTGMDRLMEVSKVATLMRRCENPRAVTFICKPEQRAAEPHGYFEPLMRGWRAGEPGSPEIGASLVKPAAFLGTGRAISAPGAQAHQLAGAALKGRTLRVSAAAAFRVKALQVPRLNPAPASNAGKGPTWTPAAGLPSTSAAGRPLRGGKAPARTAALAFTAPAASIPAKTATRTIPSLGGPQGKPKLDFKQAAGTGNLMPRPAAVRFMGHDGTSGKES